MARKRRMVVSALNVKTQPHSPETYIRLFHDAYRMGVVGKIRGDDWGMIGTLKDEKDNKQFLHGYLYKFMNINPDDPWLNLETRQPIVTEKGDPIPQVPERLKPNLRPVRYLFDPSHHRLFFESRLLSPGNARRLVAGIFSDQSIFKKYGPVDVELETSQEVLDRIMAIHMLSKLEIMVSKPNPDDIGSQAERVFERMEKQNARKLEEKWTSTKGESIRPDEVTKGTMKAATSNGRVTAVGYDREDQKVVESTESHPMTAQVLYDPDTGESLRVFKEAVEELWRRIRGKE